MYLLNFREKKMTNLTIGAMPYSFEGSMFEFSNMDQFKTKWKDLYDRKGTEEYSLEFLDGSKIEQKIYKTLKIDSVGSVDPKDLELFFEILSSSKIKTEAQAFAFWFCVSYLGYKPFEAFDVFTDLYIFEGTPEEYAEEYVYSCVPSCDIPAIIQDFIDFERMGQDMEDSGSLVYFKEEGFCVDPHSV
jgi:hypothetical protein